MMYKHSATLLSATFFSVAANAGVIFQDNFDSELADGVSKTNYTSFSNWDVTNGSVDLISDPNQWSLSCAGGTGKCVDMDGSTRNAGTLTTNPLALAAGGYIRP